MRIAGRIYRHNEKEGLYIMELPKWAEVRNVVADAYDKNLFEFVSFVGNPDYPDAQILRLKREDFANLYNELYEAIERNERLLADNKKLSANFKVLQEAFFKESEENSRLNRLIGAFSSMNEKDGVNETNVSNPG